MYLSIILKNYDAHLIMENLLKFKGDGRLNCIVKDMENYISFLVNYLVFLDSYNILSLPLDKLSSNLGGF